MNSKYYQEHQRTCNILIKFIYLMVSKLFYLLMDGKHLINCLRYDRSKVKILLGKTVTNVNLKTLTILTKRLILDA